MQCGKPSRENECLMLDIGLVIAIGILGGIAVGLQSPLAGAISERVGGTASSLIIHVSGAFLSGVLLVLRGGEQIGNWRSLTWYMWIAGMFGVVLYLTLSVTFPRLGATSALVLIIVGQLFTGMVLDTFGWLGVPARPLDPMRAAGALIVIGGAYLILR